MGEPNAGRSDRAAPRCSIRPRLRAASDGFLIATIARGRKGTPMRPFGPGPASLADLGPAEIRALLGLLRSWEAPLPAPAEAGPSPAAGTGAAAGNP